MLPNPLESADLAAFTEEIFNGKLHFLCSECLRKYYECRKFLDIFRLRVKGLVSTIIQYLKNHYPGTSFKS